MQDGEAARFVAGHADADADHGDERRHAFSDLRDRLALRSSAGSRRPLVPRRFLVGCQFLKRVFRHALPVSESLLLVPVDIEWCDVVDDIFDDIDDGLFDGLGLFGVEILGDLGDGFGDLLVSVGGDRFHDLFDGFDDLFLDRFHDLFDGLFDGLGLFGVEILGDLGDGFGDHAERLQFGGGIVPTLERVDGFPVADGAPPHGVRTVLLVSDVMLCGLAEQVGLGGGSVIHADMLPQRKHPSRLAGSRVLTSVAPYQPSRSVQMECAGCNSPFQPAQNQPSQRFCSPRCRKRTWDKTHDVYSGSQRRKARGALRRTVIGLDGEGLDDPARYVMLMASNGDGIVDGDGIDTERCLSFLLGLPRSALKWGFAFSYDVNMILGSWPPRTLARLWRNVTEPGGSCSVVYDHWLVKWIPGKQFTVTDTDTSHSCTVWDVWPFVQQSFVDWVDGAGLGESGSVERIRSMKQRRDTFDAAGLAEIERYCRDEVRLLADGVTRMLDLFADTDLTPPSYFGAGSLGAVLMRKHNVSAYISQPPAEHREILASAYRGGRFENSFIGWQDDGYTLDINSAYPDAATRLPCLVHARWERRTGVVRTRHALCHVRWNLGGDSEPWGPFPVPLSTGTLLYPTTGQGWFHAAEVRAAQRVWPGKIHVTESIELHERCRHQPFAFVPGLYAERRRLKAKGDPREKVLKLAMNAMYGKLAQTVGTPPFQSLAWAGMITADTRAKILLAMVGDPDNVAMISTDGIVTKRMPDVDLGDGLGQWSVSPITDLLAIQPGLYFYTKPDGDQVVRSRGFGRSDLSFADAAALLPRGVTPSPLDVLMAHMPTTVRRFSGLGTTVRRGAWDDWRTWSDVESRISINPWPRRAKFRCTEHGITTYAPNALPDDDGAGRDAADWRARTIEHDANNDGG